MANVFIRNYRFLGGNNVSNGIPITYDDSTIFIFIFDCHIITDAGFIIPPYIINVTKNPNTHISVFVLRKMPFDFIHAVSTVFFLFFAAEPMLEKLEIIKIKYGLIE